MSDDVLKEVKQGNVLSHNIKFLRKQLGISQEELAKRLGIKRSNIAAYESKFIEPKLAIILKMATLFNIRLETLIDSKLENMNFPQNNMEETLLVKDQTKSLDLAGNTDIQEFVEKTINIRKVLEGFKAFHNFKKEKLAESKFPNKEKLLFEIENFMQLMEHLLTHNESVIKAISSTKAKQGT